MNKRFLVSGIGPDNDGGVGRLMRRLVPQAQACEFEVVCPGFTAPIGILIRERRFLAAIITVLRRWFAYRLFAWKGGRIRNSTVILLHPQTIGFPMLLRLIRSNKAYLYVMDNSFFCMRSYNIDPETETECLRCLANPDAVKPTCRPFPVPILKSMNTRYLKELKHLSSRINFLAQNPMQAELLRQHFGNSIKVTLVGLETGEVGVSSVEKLDSLEYEYDFVFHGAANLAKGLRFFVEIAELMPARSAFIPASRVECETEIGRSITARNIVFRACNWENGLKDSIQRARLVFNPSLWSAPIEGALLKSLAYARAVATVQTVYGFEAELSIQVPLLRLPSNPSDAITVIEDFLARNPSSHPYGHYQQNFADIFDAVNGAV